MPWEVHDGAKMIEAMPRNDFHLKFVRGVGKTRSFGALASLMAENISPEEKQEVRMALAEIGIPLEMTETNEELNEIAAVASARAVTLR